MTFSISFILVFLVFFFDRLDALSRLPTGSAAKNSRPIGPITHKSVLLLTSKPLSLVENVRFTTIQDLETGVNKFQTKTQNYLSILVNGRCKTKRRRERSRKRVITARRKVKRKRRMKSKRSRRSRGKNWWTKGKRRRWLK